MSSRSSVDIADTTTPPSSSTPNTDQNPTGSKHLFRCRTREAHIFKGLADLLQYSIKIGCFVFNSEGISLCTTDSHQRLLIDLQLEHNNFDFYRCNLTNIYKGINLSHLYKMTKAIKKKDTLSLFIDENDPSSLQIQIQPKDNIRTLLSTIRIQDSQNMQIELPTGYTNSPMLVPSGEFSKMCKDLNNIGKLITVRAGINWIKFRCTTGGFFEREVVFNNDQEPVDMDTQIYHHEFCTNQLTKLMKVAALSTNIQVYAHQDLPLLFRLMVGQLGRISIYVKSNSQALDEETDEELEAST